MKNRKNRKNIVIILASLLIFALAVSLAYFTDHWSSEEYEANADTLGFEVEEVKVEELTLMAPGDARFFNYQVENVKGLAMDVRATFQMVGDLPDNAGDKGGFSVYDAADVLGYNYDQGYTLREGAAPLVNSLDAANPDPYYAGVIHGLNDKPNVHPEGLFFSAYVEGSGHNKAIELFNSYAETVDLSDYEIQIFSNGNTSPNFRIKDLPGTLEPGKTYLIAHSSAVQALQDKADKLVNNLDFNGDDALVLLQNGKVADRFGIVGERPAPSGWGGVTTDRTLVRLPNVWKGRVAPYTEFIPTNEWQVYDRDTFHVLGTHSANTPDNAWRRLDIDLVLVLEEDSGNEWQKAEMKLTTTIEGRQYRNATDPNGKGGW